MGWWAKKELKSAGRVGIDTEDKMKIITVHVPRTWIKELDMLVTEGKSPNRSELIRYAIRDLLVDEGVFRPGKKEVF